MVFSYAVEIEAADLINAPSYYTTDKSNTGIHSLEMAPEPEDESAPDPGPPEVGSNNFATVTEGPGEVITITRHDTGAELTVAIGGHVRQAVGDGRGGQTYLIARNSDGDVVRRWVAPDSVEVNFVDWPVVEMNYTFPLGVLAAIPLDEQNPRPNQLVQAYGAYEIYVYTTTGGWRHIPNIPTFEAQGFYWCNVTTGDAEFWLRVPDSMVGTALPASPRGVPNHPSCHN